MEHLAQLLQEHFRNHPGMELRDAIKFLYQSSMGGGHLIADPRGALARLEEEWARTEGDPALSPTEPLGGGLCRLSLAACKGLGLAPSTVFALFLRGTEEFSRQPERLDRSLELLYRLPFPPKEIEAAIRQYRAAGLPMVGHSTAYRQAFSPAYRVVLQSDAALLPLLAAIDRSRREHPRTLTAMDGPCATGKSTLGARLARLYSCPLFHMDDFFLPPERKTPERLAQPGGNVDYERFFAQVLSPLSRGEPVLYQPYRCHSGTLEAARTIPPPPWLWWKEFTPCAQNFSPCIRSSAFSPPPGRCGKPACWTGAARTGWSASGLSGSHWRISIFGRFLFPAPVMCTWRPAQVRAGHRVPPRTEP